MIGNDCNKYEHDYENMSDDEIEYVKSFPNPSALIPINIRTIKPEDIIYDDIQDIRKFIYGKIYDLNLINYFLINDQIEKLIKVINCLDNFYYLCKKFTKDKSNVTIEHINKLILFMSKTHCEYNQYFNNTLIYPYIGFHIDILVENGSFRYIDFEDGISKFEYNEIDIFLVYVSTYTYKLKSCELYEKFKDTILDNIEYIHQKKDRLIGNLCIHFSKKTVEFISYIMENHAIMINFDEIIGEILSDVIDYDHAIKIIELIGGKPTVRNTLSGKMENVTKEILLRLHFNDKISFIINNFSYHDFFGDDVELFCRYHLLEYEKTNNTEYIFEIISNCIRQFSPNKLLYIDGLYKLTKCYYDKLVISLDNFVGLSTTQDVSEWIMQLLLTDSLILNTDDNNIYLQMMLRCDNIDFMEIIFQYITKSDEKIFIGNDLIKCNMDLYYSDEDNDKHYSDTKQYVKFIIDKYHAGYIIVDKNYGPYLFSHMGVLKIDQAKELMGILTDAGIECSFDGYDFRQLYYDSSYSGDFQLREPIEAIYWLNELSNTFGWKYKNFNNLLNEELYACWNDKNINKILVNENVIKIHDKIILQEKYSNKYSNKYFG